MSQNNDCVVLIRAHRLSDQLMAALKRYDSIGVHDVYILYDNDRQDFVPFGIPAILMTSDALSETELLYAPGNMHFGLWKNGDYALYYAMLKLPKVYKYYWMIEYDVHINYRNLNDFFQHFASSETDFIAPYLSRRNASWMWAPHADWLFPAIYGCLFPIVRISAKALHHCYTARLYHGYKLKAHGLRGRNWPHCEAFVPSQLAQSCFSIRDLNEPEQRFCDLTWFHVEPNRAYHLDNEIFTHPDNRLYHPVYP
jgi:hypothetical protein